MENFSPEYEEPTRNQRDFADVLNDLSQSDLEIAEEAILELQSHSISYLVRKLNESINARLNTGFYEIKEISSGGFATIKVDGIEVAIYGMEFISYVSSDKFKIESSDLKTEMFNKKVSDFEKKNITLQIEEAQKRIDELTKKL